MMGTPFGLKKAFSVFTLTMTKVLAGCESFALAYIDGVLVYTRRQNFGSHLVELGKVFERLREFNLKLSPRKCEFAQKSVTFLGHRILSHSYVPSPANLRAIKKFPPPKNIEGV